MLTSKATVPANEFSKGVLVETTLNGRVYLTIDEVNLKKEAIRCVLVYRNSPSSFVLGEVSSLDITELKIFRGSIELTQD